MIKSIISALLIVAIALSGCGQNVETTTSTTTIQATTETTQMPKVTSVLPMPKAEVIVIEADDNGNYPTSITVNEGDNVKVTFKVREDNVYYGGLDFRSSYFNTGKIRPGSSKTVEFIADKTFTYTSYWPSSNVKKADGTVVVT